MARDYRKEYDRYQGKVTVKTYIIETTILLIIVLGILWCGARAVTDRSKGIKTPDTLK